MKDLITDKTLLRRPCQPCSSVAEGLRIGRDLLKFVRSYNREKLSNRAVGLAAPQLGILKQACVLALENETLVLVNPRIVDASGPLIAWQESCISLPGQKTWTWRHTWVKVLTDNIRLPLHFGLKEPCEHRKQLLESVCVQHEIAHCFSLLIDDFQEEMSFASVMEKHASDQLLAVRAGDDRL